MTDEWWLMTDDFSEYDFPFNWKFCPHQNTILDYKTTSLSFKYKVWLLVIGYYFVYIEVYYSTYTKRTNNQSPD